MRFPVVLLHGVGASSSLPGMGLSGLAADLRRCGVRAYAPIAPPYAPIADRVPVWAGHLEAVLRETGAQRLHLLGHSMGGLDARALAALPAWQGRIASLVTLATPHRGSPLADIALAQPDLAAKLALPVMQWVGRWVYPQAAPKVQEALYELTPGFLETHFNPAHAVPTAFYTASLTAQIGPGTHAAVPPWLRLLYDRLAPLPNDGYVPTASGDWSRPLGRLEADHLAQIALTPGPPTFRAAALFRALAAHLAREAE